MYQVRIERPAVKKIEKIPEPDYSRVKEAILSLAEDPRPYGYIKLKGREAYRIRQGNYRVIYEIHEKILTVIVVDAGHRKDIY